MVISEAVYHTILSLMPAVPPEAGAVLGSHGDYIDVFAYDSGLPQYGAAMHVPRVTHINQIIQRWSDAGIQFRGFAHSHPFGQGTLSASDIQYIDQIMHAMPSSIQELYFPLVFPGKEIISYVALKGTYGVEIHPDNIKIML